MVVAREEHADRHLLVGDCLHKAAIQSLDGNQTAQKKLIEAKVLGWRAKGIEQVVRNGLQPSASLA